jgi:hypothetical protein
MKVLLRNEESLRTLFLILLVVLMTIALYTKQVVISNEGRFSGISKRYFVLTAIAILLWDVFAFGSVVLI